MTLRHAEGSPTRQVITGAVIAASAIGAVFWWGLHFDVFGSEIDFAAHPEQLGLPILIAVAVFGGAYALAGLSGGIRTVGRIIFILVAAYWVGVARHILS